jgi:predicted  nucleic acid-binding Zn-ribbon protein
MNFQSEESLSELQKLAATPQVREGSSPVRPLSTLALENEAELAVTKQRLHKALATGKPAPKSRKVLSRAWRATQCGLLNAQPSRGCAEAGGRREQAKGTAKQTKAPKVKDAKRTADEDTVRVEDSEVERQVDERMRLDQEDEEEGPPEAELVQGEEHFGIDEEDIPEAESSAVATRWGPARRCKGG